MPESTVVIVNGQPVTIEKIITSGDLLVAMTTTISISLLLGIIVLFLFGGRK